MPRQTPAPVMLLVPVKFEVCGHTFRHHRVFIEARATGWVCMTSGDSCLNTDGEFEWEPLNSSQTDDFKARTRFETAEAALDNFKKHLPNFGEHW